MIYLILAYEFFKIGLFSIGGGMATLPFLMDLANKYDWFTVSGPHGPCMDYYYIDCKVSGEFQ